MNKENIKTITDKEELYEYCENVEQLFDKFYLPLLDIHYKKTYQLKQEIMKLNNLIGKATNYYLKTLDKNGSMPDEAVEMYNLLEGNK